ncbi:MAG: M6 family metalloprotease domain-containing protein [Bacteroidales bacterium]|nr:M6 family metalloprotease domain-containing protein [Bacteroidales bacterium]
MKRIASALVALLAFSLQLLAVKAYPYPVTVQQPDGSTMTIRIHGDENHSWKTNLEGRPVCQGPDGFWRVTDSLPERPSVLKSLNPEGGALSMFLATKAHVSVRTLVIPVQFSDRKFTVPLPRNAIYNLFNQQYYSENGATGSVLDWFRDNLDGYGNFSFEVCDVVTVPYSQAWYGANADGVTDKNVRQLVLHACEAADAAGVDFTRYDFDHDGIVDNVFIIFAGHNEAEGGGDNTLWPQSWNIADMGLKIDGMRISNFSLYSEYSGPSGYQFAGIGTICHEYCHFLGLPDLYDVNDETEGLSDGLFGSLSIMDHGNYNNNGRTPPYLTIFERQMIGLIQTETIRREQPLVVPPVQDATRAYVLSSGIPGEDFWLEFRDGYRWDAHIGGSGLVVYHIDKSINQAGSMAARLRWSANAVNGCAEHPCAMFVSSNGGTATSVKEAFYPGKRNVRNIHSASNFPHIGWNGKGVGLGLTDIVREADGIRCNVVNDDSWDLPVVTGWSILPGQTSALLEWQTDKNSSGQWNIRWGILDGVTSETVQVGSQKRYIFDGLIPGQSYFCELYYTRWSVKGRTQRIEFSALDRLSDYPLIGGLDREWKSGELFRLFLLNLPEGIAAVSWEIDNLPYAADTFFFEKAGSYKISATLTYADGSKEVLTKILEVKNAS